MHIGIIDRTNRTIFLPQIIHCHHNIHLFVPQVRTHSVNVFALVNLQIGEKVCQYIHDLRLANAGARVLSEKRGNFANLDFRFRLVVYHGLVPELEKLVDRWQIFATDSHKTVVIFRIMLLQQGD